MTKLCRLEEHGVAGGIGCVRVRILFEKQLHALDEPVRAAMMRGAALVGSLLIRVRPQLEEELANVLVAVLARAHKGSAAILLALADESNHRLGQ